MARGVYEARFDWSAENVERLRALLEDGKSAGEVAKIFGTTRNTVMGKAKRLKFQLRGSASGGGVSKAETSRKRDRKRIRTVLTAEPILVGPKPTAGERGAIEFAAAFRRSREEATHATTVTPLSALRRTNCCKWAIGEPSDPAFGFCGAPTEHRRIFCETHAKRATIPPRSNDVQRTADWIHSVDRLGSVKRY